MARRLLLCKVGVYAHRPVFDDLLRASERQGVAWDVALERLECEVQLAAERRALELIAEWLGDEAEAGS